MSAVSETYADLGGGLRSTPAPTVRAERVHLPSAQRTPGAVCERHLFDPVSGWCGCGTRDDGKLAEGSPAWRTVVESTMPGRNS